MACVDNLSEPAPGATPEDLFLPQFSLDFRGITMVFSCILYTSLQV